MSALGIPGVDTVRAHPTVCELLETMPRAVVVACVRECVAEVRQERLAANAPAPPAEDSAARVAAMVAARLAASGPRSLRRVVNATGVILHTNLGRSALSAEALDAIREVGGAYCNLEVDVATGERSKRELHVAELLARLTGAEAATVVNNNAAAVVLALTALAGGQQVVCSRGELVEIGGSFRMPDVVEWSGARMVDVGTTNHTRLADYEAALTDETAAILKTHPSNFRLVGFHSEVEVAPLAELARRSGVVVIFDAGSGLLLPDEQPCFADEPVIRQAVADGADVVTFSTDKLLGGPQGGVLVGRRSLIERINRHPLKRAFRVGKLTMAGLEATLRSHLRPGGGADTVTHRLIRTPITELEQAAQALASAIQGAAPGWQTAIEPDEAFIGGGSLPGECLPTVVVWVEAPPRPADVLAQAFRANEPPIFGRFRRGRFGIDVRTLLPGDGDDIVACAQRLAAEAGS
ncbi:L-seryl-tRNA(Sec) selenium transferase [bacterium]|nr:L-seryl-tRNA(Sec) selenium transferase [bacterium]